MNDMAMNYAPAAVAILLGCLALLGPGWGAMGAFLGCVLCFAGPLFPGWPAPAMDPAVARSVQDVDCMVGGILLGIMLVFIVRWQERRSASAPRVGEQSRMVEE